MRGCLEAIVPVTQAAELLMAAPQIPCVMPAAVGKTASPAARQMNNVISRQAIYSVVKPSSTGMRDVKFNSSSVLKTQELQAEAIFATPASGNFLAKLSVDERKTVIGAADRIRVKKNGLLFSQGERHRGVILIQSGVVRIFYVAPNGREFTVAFWQQGNLAGTPDLFADREDSVYRWSGIASASVDALIFRPGRLRELVKEIPQLAVEIIEALEVKIRMTSALLQMLGTMRVNERLLSCLRTLALAHGVQTPNGMVLQTPFTHESIATMVGASRQWTTLELNKMQRRGDLKLGRNMLTILRPELLQEVEF